MADPPTTNHIAESNTAVADTSADDMTEYTDAHPGGMSDTTGTMPTSPNKPSAATRTINPTERAATLLTAPNHVDIAALEAKPWPRLHLLGLPRELRDQICTYAVVSDEPVFIGPINKRFENIPPLTRVSRQLRSETHRMFLEQNTLEINEYALMTNRSSKPFKVFKALCAGSELRNICMDSSRFIGRGDLRVEIMADLIVVKTNHGLKVSLPVLFSAHDDLFCTLDTYEVCGCRAERLANEYGGQKGAVVHFLGALRQDWMDHSHGECRSHMCKFERDKHCSCTVGQDLELCDVHQGSLLY
ncbi:hypothetical protein Q7P35_010046 [Cladosporium inversicolor]